MRSMSLPIGGSSRLTREGPLLRVLNAPLVNPALKTDLPPSPTVGILTLATIVVGFDRQPTLDNFDAIVPPYTDHTFEVPDSVGTVYFAWPANSFPTNGGADGTQFFVEWLPCGDAAPGIRVVRLAVPAFSGGTPWAHGSDLFGNRWQPEAQTPIADFAADSTYANNVPTLRPKIAPSVIQTVHVAVTGIKTIFDLYRTGDASGDPLEEYLYAFGRYSTGGWRTVHRIYASVSIATLVVIGTFGLTVGDPGAQEVFRGLIPAGQAFPIEFGEGMDTNRGSVGQWRAYTNLSCVFDATVIGG